MQPSHPMSHPLSPGARTALLHRSLAALLPARPNCAKISVHASTGSRIVRCQAASDDGKPPGFPNVTYPAEQEWLWDQPPVKTSIVALGQEANATPTWLNIIEGTHWLSFPIGFAVFYLIFSNEAALAEKLGSTAQVFCALMGLASQVYGGGLSGNMMHEYEGWQVAPFRNPLQSNPIEQVPNYNNAWLRSVAYRYLFAFQTAGLLLFSLAAFGLTLPMLLWAAASLFVAFVGPRQPRFIFYIFGQPVIPLPLPLLLIFVLNATLDLLANVHVFGSSMEGALGPAPGWLLASVPALLVALGGIIEGLLAESTFDQRWHLFAFLLLDVGLGLHAWLYLNLLAH